MAEICPERSSSTVKNQLHNLAPNQLHEHTSPIPSQINEYSLRIRALRRPRILTTPYKPSRPWPSSPNTIRPSTLVLLLLLLLLVLLLLSVLRTRIRISVTH